MKNQLFEVFREMQIKRNDVSLWIVLVMMLEEEEDDDIVQKI